MRKFLSLFAPLLLAVSFAGWTSPALSAAEDAAIVTDAHEDLYSAMEEGVDQGLMKEQVLGTVITAFKQEIPEIALIEDAQPGFIEKLRTDLRPIMSDYSDRVKLEYRPKMVAALRAMLTPDEAREVAAFYRSPLGKKLLAGASQNYDLDDTASKALRNPDADIQSETLETDFRRMGVQAYLGLTPAERKQMGTVPAQYPALMKFVADQSGIMAIRVQMENEPLNSDEDARLEKMIKAAFDDLGSDDATAGEQVN